MARSNPKTTDNTVVKAGKKKHYKAPPPVNKDKQDARLLGNQQFYSKVNFTVEVQTIKIKDGVLIPSIKHVPIPYKYDPTRKRLVYNSFYVQGKGNGQDNRKEVS